MFLSRQMGKPVITVAERGIVAAASYEAKALGIQRGVSLSEATRLCPQLILLPSDYELYSIFSKRMFTIMRRYSPLVEESSIDEGFIDLTGTRRLHHKGYKEIATALQQEIENELGMTVSIGISLSKSLAKLCSKFRKPCGLTAVKGRHIHLLLEKTPLHEVWGFGPNTTALLEKHGLRTALNFVHRPLDWVENLLGKVGHDIWMELRGESVWNVNPEMGRSPLSISKMKTFTPASSDREYVKARALRNLESACIKARRYGLAAKQLILSLRSQGFESSACEMKLQRASSAPTELGAALISLFDKLFQPKTSYRATGVVLSHLTDPLPTQFGLFENPQQAINAANAFHAVDQLAEKYGKHAVFLADGLRLGDQHSGRQGEAAYRKQNLFKGESARQRLKIPMVH